MMGEEFYCILKLVSGEEILSLISIDDSFDEPIVILQNPIIVKVVQHQHGFFVKVKPWMELSSDEIFIIRKDKIITMTETTDERLISIYNNYQKDEDDEDGIMTLNNNIHQVKPSTKMGYISTVEDARKKLENLFDGPKDERAGT